MHSFMHNLVAQFSMLGIMIMYLINAILKNNPDPETLTFFDSSKIRMSLFKMKLVSKVDLNDNSCNIISFCSQRDFNHDDDWYNPRWISD